MVRKSLVVFPFDSTSATAVSEGFGEEIASYLKSVLSGSDGYMAVLYLSLIHISRSIDGGEPRYYHSKYRLIKSLSQAYPPKTDSLGNPVLDPVTKLPLLKPCYISLKTCLLYTSRCV